MAVAEIHPELSNASFSERLRGTLELAVPNLEVESVLDIDFVELVAMGFDTVLIDGESTFLNQGGWDVRRAIQKKFKEEARDAGVRKLGVMSNNRPADDTGWVQVAWWGHQIGSDKVFVPILLGDRKPEESMLERSIEEFESKPTKTVMIGDKISADIVAGNRAGVYTILVERLGSTDLMGDRVLRRPAEKIWRLIYPTLISEGTVVSQAVPPHLYRERPPVATINRSMPPKEVIGLGLIFGFKVVEVAETGIQEVVLEDKIQRELDEAKLAYDGLVGKVYDFLGDHGGLVADINTALRIPLKVGAVAALVNKRPKLAAVLNFLGDITDFLDGLASRHSNEPKDSPRRIFMGRVEGVVDHTANGIVGISLAKLGLKKWKYMVIQGAREVKREFQREHYKSHHPEIDTRATMSGKLATVGQMVADEATIISGNSQSRLIDWLHAAASALKVVSYFESPSQWSYRQREKKIGQTVLEIMKAERKPDIEEAS